jgi:glycerate kinase
MRIIVAPDSFKGSLSSVDASLSIKKGILRIFPHADVITVPVADGGEGTVYAITSMNNGEIMHTIVEGPLNTQVDAIWGLIQTPKGPTAIIEMAEASGLLLVPAEERNEQNIRHSSTYGTGQLIRAALDHGVKNIIIGIGGSATNDGGAGMAQALGAKFLNVDNTALPRGGAALINLDHINISELDPRLKDTNILIASDVNNPLCGVQGASAIYGPQKGATPEIIQELDRALFHYSTIAKQDLGLDISHIAGGGAAGGLGAGLILFTNAKMRNGIQVILESIEFTKILRNADLVITGEGHTDDQTLNGKAPIGIAKIAKQLQIPVLCLSGALGENANAVINAGIDAIASTPCSPITLTECLRNADKLLADAAERCCQLIKLGTTLKNIQ